MVSTLPKTQSCQDNICSIFVLYSTINIPTSYNFTNGRIPSLLKTNSNILKIVNYIAPSPSPITITTTIITNFTLTFFKLFTILNPLQFWCIQSVNEKVDTKLLSIKLYDTMFTKLMKTLIFIAFSIRIIHYCGLTVRIYFLWPGPYYGFTDF